MNSPARYPAHSRSAEWRVHSRCRLKIRAEGTAFRATGESAVKLSDYGIEQPSQFGVKTADEIQLHIEFSAKEGPAKIASGGRP